jgi:RNA polymerase sigma factor (sigma-70 family)
MDGAALAHLLRELAPQVLGALVRRHRDFAACEDAVQEALVAAAEQWPRYGRPDEPAAWLVKVARRRYADHVRSEVARRAREAEHADETPDIVMPAHDDDARIDPHDTLVLLFLCCHPALSDAAAIALTLRAVGGLTTREIARAFLVPDATMGQRITRAKQAIVDSGVPFELPDAGERAQRLGNVLHVLYLVFNEGYTASAGESLQRTDLADESIRLARNLHALLPGDAEVEGLLALMLLVDARRAARTGPDGGIVPLDAQDRTRWDRARIDEGVALVESALRRGAVGEYQLLAAINAVHDEAATSAATDWPQVLALYTVLLRVSDSPMVVLNHAIATAEVHGPQAGLALLAPLDGDERLREHHRLAAVRAHLLERAGDHVAAEALYRAAATKTASTPERDYLLGRAARLRDEGA